MTHRRHSPRNYAFYQICSSRRPIEIGDLGYKPASASRTSVYVTHIPPCYTEARAPRQSSRHCRRLVACIQWFAPPPAMAQVAPAASGPSFVVRAILAKEQEMLATVIKREDLTEAHGSTTANLVGAPRGGSHGQESARQSGEAGQGGSRSAACAPPGFPRRRQGLPRAPGTPTVSFRASLVHVRDTL